MEQFQLTKRAIEETMGRPLNDDEVNEIVSNLVSYIEMLTEIDQQIKALSNNQHKEKE